MKACGDSSCPPDPRRKDVARAMKQGILIGAVLLGVGGGAWSHPTWPGEGERRGDPPGEPPPAFLAGLATITAADLERHASALAGPELEGRDSPSAGLELAARYIEGELQAAGLEPLGGDLRYRLPFAQRAAARRSPGTRYAAFSQRTQSSAFLGSGRGRGS